MLEMPPIEAYKNFMIDFTRGLETHHPDVCFYHYGSGCRGEWSPEKGSDVDGGLILDEGVRTDKSKVLDISRMLRDCHRKNPIPLQLNLNDRQTVVDGRFLSYTRDYLDHFERESEIVCGPDFLGEAKGFDYKSGPLYSAAFNLRKLRNRLLSLYDTLENGPHEFEENLLTSIGHAVKFPKKLIWLRGRDDIVTSFPESLKVLREDVLPSFDVSLLEKLNSFRNIPLLNQLFKADLETCVQLYCQSCEAVEELVGAYIERYPEVSDRELRG
ncbi:MAG: hypothetical protein KKF56_02535 [Nanoarchaeota archaeon]|nr:hypothetical protein [Nanoarchaeota archaeon]